MDTANQCHRIVILGAGFGGLTAAVRLSKRLGKRQNCEIVIIDKHTHHLYRPWLYEVATGNAPEAQLETGVATPYEDLRGHLASVGVRVEYEEAVGIDWTAKALTLADDRKLGFDDLIVAVGAVPDFYGIEGLEQHGHPLYSLQDALVVNRHLRELIAKKMRGEIPFIRVLIGGAGPTGVEFACEAAAFMRSRVKQGALSAGGWSIELVEASPRVLPAFNRQLSDWAKARLEKLGVKMILDACIKGAHKDHVVLAPRPLKPGETEDMLVCDFKKEHEKEVTTDLLVWCGGFKARPLIKAMGLPVDGRGWIQVDATLQIQGRPHVWAIGDCMSLMDEKAKHPVPRLAQGAIHQGELVAENIVRLMRNEKPESYHFPAMHTLVPMGGAWGVAEVYGVRFRGVLVWPVRLAADIRYFLKTLPLGSAWKMIRAPLTTFRRNNL